MKLLTILGLLLLTACAQPAPTALPPSPTLPSTKPPPAAQTTVAVQTLATQTETGEPEPTPTTAAPADIPPQLPGGRLLFSALASAEVRNADPLHPRAHEYFWLNLPDRSVEPVVLLSGVYPIFDKFALLSPDLLTLAFERQSFTQAGDNLFAEASSSIILASPADDSGTPIGLPFAADALRGSSWSGDNRFFAYWRHLDWYGFEDEHFIYIYELSTGALDTITIQATQPWTAALSSDSSLIAFSAVGNIPSLYLIRADGTDQQVLVEGLVQEIAWHPDGNRLFYIESSPETGVFSYDISTGAVTLITATSDSAARLDISPDGQLLAYDDKGLLVVSPDGGSPVRLTDGWTIAEWAWSPDSGTIAYISTLSGSISLVNVSGGGSVTVYDGDYEPYQMIGWLP
ncbi:MAG TPA: hypothetical protein VMN57_15795 [Anaerolineales bacterium]|nr:hypothetical protein [Anaerolineales bacterium]